MRESDWVMGWREAWKEGDEKRKRKTEEGNMRNRRKGQNKHGKK